MYEQLSISGYRGIRNLVIHDLARVNLFVGPNNVGKTSLLEAAWLLRAPGNPSLLINIAQFRGVSLSVLPGTTNIAVSPDLLWTPLFHGLDSGGTIKIGAREDGIDEELIIQIDRSPRTVVLDGRDLGDVKGTSDTAHSSRSPSLIQEALEYVYTQTGKKDLRTKAEVRDGRLDFSVNEELTRFAVYLSARRAVSEQELAERFTKLEDTEALNVLIPTLRAFDARLHGLSLGFIAGRPVIRGRFQGQQFLPLYFFGDGIVHLVNIILSIGSARNGTVMIDEIENGIYYRNLQTYWETIGRATVLSNAQVFATTHSSECVVAALRAFGGSAHDVFRLFRLEDKGDRTQAVEYDVQTAEAAFAMDLEVR